MLLTRKILFYTLKILKLNNFKFNTEYGKVYLDFNNEGISQILFYRKKESLIKLN